MSICSRIIIIASALLLICRHSSWAPLTDTCLEDPDGIEEFVDPQSIIAPYDAKQNGESSSSKHNDAPVIPDPVLPVSVPQDLLTRPFDARTYEPWLKCTSISHIWNQGNCNVCFVIVAVALITDHLCIWGDQKTTKWISAGQAAACRTNPQSDRANCVNGGTIEQIFSRVASEGINTGGPKKKYGGCAPYLIPSWKSCFIKTEQTIACQPSCADKTPIARDKVSIYGAWFKFVPEYSKLEEKQALVTEMKKAILTRGPIGAAIVVYKDFIKFDFGKEKDAQKNAYIKSQGTDEIGGHAIRIVGWEMCKGGIECWIIANSWGQTWGVNGFGYVAVLNSGIQIETAVSSPVVHHPDAPKENKCSTARFCGAGPIDQALSSNPMDPDAPFYLIQGGCAQQVVFKNGGLVTSGIAVPMQWVFPDAPTATITRYTLIEDSRLMTFGPKPFIGVWIYDAQQGAAYCRPVTDQKLACSKPKVIRPEDNGPAARAMYFESGLKTLSYDHTATPSTITTETPQVTITVPEVIFKKYGKIYAVLYLGLQNIALFGTTGPNGSGDPISGIYTCAKGGVLTEVQPANKKPLTCE